jgi:hypothetical protein
MHVEITTFSGCQICENTPFDKRPKDFFPHEEVKILHRVTFDLNSIVDTERLLKYLSEHENWTYRIL